MQFIRCNLETCRQSVIDHPQAVVVVIDVLRAFTTAAHLFNAGAREIALVASIEDALAWRSRDAACLLLGENKGHKLEGFDLGNSPFYIDQNGISAGVRVVQLTTCGTRGAVYAAEAAAQAGREVPIFCAALTNGAATARAIRSGGWQTVILVETGVFPDGIGDEDVAFSDYLIHILSPDDSQLDLVSLQQRVRHCKTAHLFDGSSPDLPPSDLGCAVDIDRFDFAMPVQHTAEGLILTVSKTGFVDIH